MLKKALLILLLLCALVPFVPAQAESAADIRGYSAKKGYQYVQFGAYFTDKDGTKRPIVWRVLRSAKGEAYILSELILFGCPLHGDYMHYEGWEKSDLYKYLNSTFKNDAFSPAEQSALLVRTEDKAQVTLITASEMKDKSLGFVSDKSRLCESTAWAKILQNPPLWELPKTNNKGKWKKLYIYSDGHKYSPWWSRTRSDAYKHEQRRVKDDGKVGRISVGNSDLGARPAITLDLSKVTIVSGKGTLASPFLLSVKDDSPSGNDATPKPVKATAKPAAKATAKPAAKATAKPAATASASGSVFSAAADPAHIRKEFPTLTAEGFLPAGEAEFVYQDAKAGLWLYASQTLRVQIQRKEGKIDEYDGKKKVKTWTTRWYETHIFIRDKSELLDFYPVNENEYFKKYPQVKDADEIARLNHMVVAFNTDYFNYRVTRAFEKGATASKLKNYSIGIVIRNGKILFEKTKKENSTDLPPLDAMAFYPDGSTTVHVSSSVTAQQLIKAGATDVVSFGPVLVDQGEVSPRAGKYGKVLNPRTGFGTVEPGHYVHIVADGRLANEGIKGVTCTWLAEQLKKAGCQNAINLDGGASGVLIFMGKKLNKTGNYGTGVAANRDYNEMMGFGQSKLVK